MMTIEPVYVGSSREKLGELQRRTRDAYGHWSRMKSAQKGVRFFAMLAAFGSACEAKCGDVKKFDPVMRGKFLSQSERNRISTGTPWSEDTKFIGKAGQLIAKQTCSNCKTSTVEVVVLASISSR